MKVEIDAQSGLVLRDPQGRLIWSTEDIIVDGVSHGFLNDTGNFVLVRSDSISIWESFKYPSDTVLLTQIIAINGTLVSRKSGTNFSRGRFYLRMLRGGNLVLNTRSVPTNSDFDDEYYNTQTADPANASNSGYQLVFDDRGSLYVLRKNRERRALTRKRSIPTTSDHYYRATLDFDGVFRTYYYPKSFNGDPGWTVAEHWPLNICMNINGEKGSGAYSKMEDQFVNALEKVTVKMPARMIVYVGGAFGIVYKGVMPTGSNSTIAVKMLDRVAQDTEKEFKTEVNVIGQTHHKNLVRLLGFCEEGPHRMLVYEYMNNGTLASFLFGDLKPNWNRRIQITLEIARGLAYLHEECSTQIIHCDIKRQNIILDEYFNAWISDFGLAKLLMISQSRTLNNSRGTKGYVALEWFKDTQVTSKVDVYSFGVLLLEIIVCRKSLIDSKFGKGENPILTDWVWDCFHERTLNTLVKNDIEALNDKKGPESFVMFGIWCIQEDSSLRPTMRKVIQMLKEILEVNIPPLPISFRLNGLRY
ncbi:G-type lectin S-receptor-like serine threonine-kinase RLK1 [Olea europaea subsp. europaea]|uniref:G-type lectin S-receptor-like serine threonine-kinase RLK1 n=1 Tax=Olea europaea subsp. europaea TaxID=158383 RepID=A0A8S0SEA7_OLEEU|nr:G-type lectin S-receptor-like serine threonine-kinase RLK1 [Olea europaea subsp. europaea]